MLLFCPKHWSSVNNPKCPCGRLTVDSDTEAGSCFVANSVVGCALIVACIFVGANIEHLQLVPSVNRRPDPPDSCPRDVGRGISWSVAVGQQRVRLVDAHISRYDIEHSRNYRSMNRTNTNASQADFTIVLSRNLSNANLIFFAVKHLCHSLSWISRCWRFIWLWLVRVTM